MKKNTNANLPVLIFMLALLIDPVCQVSHQL